MTIGWTEAIALVVTLNFAIYGLLQKWKSKQLQLPPGPPGVPIFGNMFQFPVMRPHPKMLQWAQEYGEIFYLRLGTQNVIVLNTAEAADEVLTNRSKIYSSRPAPFVVHEIISDSQRMLLMPYSKEYKAARKGIQNAIGAGPAKRLRRYQDLESRVILQDLLDHGDASLKMEFTNSPAGEPLVPEKHWFSLIRRYTTSIVLTVMYGQRIHKFDGHPFLHEIYDILATVIRALQPGSYLADVFVFLRKLPDWISPWRVEAYKLHEREMRLWGTLFNENKEAWKTGVGPECLVSSYLSQRAEKGHEDAPGRGITEDGWMRDKLLAYAAATVLEAGSDTTASMLQTIILLMLANPECIQNAREELDRVVGPDRLPTFDDFDQLPYVVACIKEAMRRRPIIPLGMGHLADEDDMYKGYYIPKGTAVLGNVWAIHMDPQRFPDPSKFNPERWIVPGKPTLLRSGNGQDSDRDHYGFGWGRRICAGITFAEASLFIVSARILWGFDFTLPIDKSGKPVVPDPEDETGTWSEGFISSPYPFNVGWKARDAKRAQVIKQSFEEAQNEWRSLGMFTDER